MARSQSAGKLASEDALIALLTSGWRQDASVRVGVGDDCAVLQIPHGRRSTLLLFKTDAVVEGVHFMRKTPLALVGRKALARVASDMAAMGGRATHAVVTVAYPSPKRKLTLAQVKELYRGLTRFAREFDIQLVGGENTTAPTLLISIAGIGSLGGALPVLRSGAKKGDLIWVTGRLGGSLPSGRHLTFLPRVKEGQWLAKQKIASGMCDLSDGLAADLPRIAVASGVDFLIKPARLPRHPKASIRAALVDGEDYELLFTASAAASRTLLQRWPFPKTRLTCIGSIVIRGTKRAAKESALMLADCQKLLPAHVRVRRLIA